MIDAEQKVSADDGQVASAQVTVSGADQSVSEAGTSATSYGTTAEFTMLPKVSTVVRRGQTLYTIDGQPTLLLYGPEPAWRAFKPGMAPGPDLAELNANLRTLGYGNGLSGDDFTDATEQAVTALQAAHGLERTGELGLGTVVFEPGAVVVTSVTPTVGQAVQAGPALGITSTREQVTIALDPSLQSDVKIGDQVTVTLPDNHTTPGVVSFVGSVATVPTSAGSSSGSAPSPTIEVDVRLTDQAAVGHLDEAPVQVSITTATVNDALVVPIDALLALAGGGYAVEAVAAGGVHELVPITLGLFDDADGLVQVTGFRLHADQNVVVPAL